ncbi:hypothetical protein IEQ34_009017 [Dendrobium chrysotoxum]|uniref:RNase H type-1 domain-containing protein n=1 Tax=Dendrobium chrysotoxum TaxID=161865 RepID=A0AAV7GY44_DENCH|nr:hypothetical protein IEQ34_009017 [Dendrobium chrysotoxum]
MRVLVVIVFIYFLISKTFSFSWLATANEREFLRDHPQDQREMMIFFLEKMSKLTIDYLYNLSNIGQPSNRRKKNVALGYLVTYILEKKYNLINPDPPTELPIFLTNASFQALFHQDQDIEGDESEEEGDAPTPAPRPDQNFYQDMALAGGLLKKAQYSIVTRRVSKDEWYSAIKRVKKDVGFSAFTKRVKKDDGSLPHQGLVLSFYSWHPPPPRWIKVNIDATLLQSYKASIGGVFRDRKGRFIVAFGFKCIHWDNGYLELLAICSLKKVVKEWMMEANGIIIVGDNYNIIKYLQDSIGEGLWDKEIDVTSALIAPPGFLDCNLVQSKDPLPNLNSPTEELSSSDNSPYIPTKQTSSSSPGFYHNPPLAPPADPPISSPNKFAILQPEKADEPPDIAPPNAVNPMKITTESAISFKNNKGKSAKKTRSSHSKSK